MSVTWKEISCGSENGNETIGNMTEYTIRNLYEGRQYNISVVVTNKAGNSTNYAIATTREAGKSATVVK